MNRCTKLLLLFYASTAPVPALAQEVTDDQIRPIIVTAQRRSQALNDVDVAVQAFDAQTLSDQRVNNVQDLTALVPSFTVSQSYQGVPTYTLRGIGFNTINLSATSTVGTYVDEVAYAYPIMNTGPLMDLERVEVLKGPQGTLYGRNTTAGLIDFITAKPKSHFEAGLTAEIGDYKTYNADGFITGPLANGVSARFAFKSENSDEGWQISNSRPNERLGKIDRQGARGSLRIEPASTTRLDLSATYWRNRSDTLAAQAIGFTPATNPAGPAIGGQFNVPGLAAYVAANPPTRASQADWAPYGERASDVGTGLGLAGPLREHADFWGLKARLDQRLADHVTLVSLTSYNDYRRNSLMDWSGAPYEIVLQNVVGHIRSFAEDLHVEGATRSLLWLIGGYYGKDTLLDSNRTLLGDNASIRTVRAATLGFNLLATPFNCCGYTITDVLQSFRTFEDVGNLKTRTWSLFANGEWQMSSKFKSTLGLRYTEDRQSYAGCSRDFNGNMLPAVNVFTHFFFYQVYGVFAPPVTEGQCTTFNTATLKSGLITSTLDESNLAWRVALDWTPKADALVYASVSRGAKAGTTPINPANLAQQNAPVRQEQLTDYEIGVKSTLAHGHMQVDGAAFYYDYKNKQISTYFADPIFTALTRLDNVPKSRAYGIEGDVTWRPMQTLNLTASALWLRTEIEDYIGINAAGQPQDYSGAEFIYSPRFQGSFSAVYDRPISSRLALKGVFNARYQTKSKSTLSDLPLYRIPAYAVVNGSLGVHSLDDRWSVTVWVRNLFNRYYFTAVTDNNNLVIRFPSPPRTFGVSASIGF